MPNIDLPIVYLVAASFSILTLSVLLLTARVTKLSRATSELKNNLKDVATTGDISLANKKLDTDLVNAMLLLENNMTQRSEELLAEVIELRTHLLKSRIPEPKAYVTEAKDFDNKLDDVIAFTQEGISSEEISARLNLNHEFVQDIIQFNRRN
jgi:uncharacterized membrane protein YdfJ with MMPL/SSD domain